MRGKAQRDGHPVLFFTILPTTIITTIITIETVGRCARGRLSELKCISGSVSVYTVQ